MRNASTAKLVYKSARTIRKDSNLARLRRSAQRPVDLSDIPEVTSRGLGESHRLAKKSVTIRLDADILAYFKSTGPGYQTKINRILRSAVSTGTDIRGELRAAAANLEMIAAKCNY